MPSVHHLLLGVDIGTGGVRALAVTSAGEVAGQVSVALDSAIVAPQPGCHEQPPEAWWEAFCQAASSLVGQLAAKGFGTRQLVALAVDGTSGTLVPLDASGSPLRPALMYNDPRGADQAEALNAAAGDFCGKLGYRFTSSFALAKIAWLADHEPDCFQRTALFVHQADYIVGRLTGEPPATDYCNALKTGYDLIDDCWPAWIAGLPGIRQRLPAVVAPGTRMGEVSRQAAARTGLPRGLPVVAGATDGTAACLASGVRQPGDYNTTLGSTLVFKGISRRICRHPLGLIYCHKLPGGLWLPGAASNTGAEWIASLFPGADPETLDAAAASQLPCPALAYPLVRTGERFPFLSGTARGFVPKEGEMSPEGRYAACLQGVAFLERLAYDVLDQSAGSAGGEVYSTGGGSRSDVWMQCRADVTGRPLCRPACAESAFGAAVLAASATCYGCLAEAVAGMVRIKRTFEPRARLAAEFGAIYGRLLGEFKERGYL